MVAPVAQPARPRPPVARGPGPLDGLPQGADLALGGEQVGFVRRVPQYLALGEVHELEQPRHLAAEAPDHQRVELHLEQRAGLVGLPGRAAGLVVHDPDLAAGRDIQPVDVAAQPQPGIERGLHVALPLGGFEPAGILEREVRVHDRDGGLQPAGPGRPHPETARPGPAPRRPAGPTPGPAALVRPPGSARRRAGRTVAPARRARASRAQWLPWAARAAGRSPGTGTAAGTS